MNTTVFDLATAFYEEALAETGDEELALEIANHLLTKTLQKRTK